MPSPKVSSSQILGQSVNFLDFGIFCTKFEFWLFAKTVDAIEFATKNWKTGPETYFFPWKYVDCFQVRPPSKTPPHIIATWQATALPLARGRSLLFQLLKGVNPPSYCYITLADLYRQVSSNLALANHLGPTTITQASSPLQCGACDWRLVQIHKLNWIEALLDLLLLGVYSQESSRQRTHT